MRKLALLIGLLAITGLTGCDWFSKPKPQPVVVTCKCAAPAMRGSIEPPAVAAPARREAHRYSRYHHDRHRYAHNGSRYDWHKRDAERSVDRYDYSSHSHRYGEEGEGRAAGTTRIWTDGYGRRHVYDVSAERHYAYQTHIARAQEAERLSPWHGYDDDWDY